MQRVAINGVRRWNRSERACPGSNALAIQVHLENCRIEFRDVPVWVLSELLAAQYDIRSPTYLSASLNAFTVGEGAQLPAIVDQKEWEVTETLVMVPTETGRVQDYRTSSLRCLNLLRSFANSEQQYSRTIHKCVLERFARLEAAGLLDSR